jgi:methyltransferase (TIGR00027 family)
MERPVSRTAIAVATHRARHVLLDEGLFFKDRLLQRLLDMSDDDLTGGNKHDRKGRRGRRMLISPKAKKVRYFLCIRSSLAISLVEEAIAARGVTNVILLGAGLDTMFFYTHFPANVKLCEVDMAQTQEWKMERLKAMGVSVDHVTFVAADLEVDDWKQKLSEAKIDLIGQRTFFVWLGVVS